MTITDYSLRMAEMTRAHGELSKHSQVAEQENLTMKVNYYLNTFKIIHISQVLP